MPTAKTDLDETQIAHLKNLVTNQSGFTITSKTDCDKLVELIDQRTKKLISVNTVRRFFEVMPSQSKPSLETLNIFSSFCGYADFYDFQRSITPTKRTDLSLAAVNDLHIQLGHSPTFFNTLNLLLQLAFRENNLPFLKTFFDLKNFTDQLDYSQGHHKKVLMTFGVELRANVPLFNELIQHYAGNPIAQALYFECFVDYDFLAMRHHKAIHVYAQHKKNKEAQLFSQCLLFLRAFLLRDQATCSDLIKKINAIDLSDDLHPFPTGRKMACTILYQAFYTGGVKKSLIQEAFDLEKRMPRTGAIERNNPSYHTIVAEAFIWAGLHDEAVMISELALASYDTTLSDKTNTTWSTLLMYRAKGLLETNRFEEAAHAFNKVNPSHFEIHDRNFYMMNYYKIGADIKKQFHLQKATSWKQFSLEIASHHQFKFFQNSH